jgi:hypothetical protein
VIDGVAHLELNRPDMAIALDLETARSSPPGWSRPGRTWMSEPFWALEPDRGSALGGAVAGFAAAPDQPAHIHRLATALDQALRWPTSRNRSSPQCAVQSQAPAWV